MDDNLFGFGPAACERDIATAQLLKRLIETMINLVARIYLTDGDCVQVQISFSEQEFARSLRRSQSTLRVAQMGSKPEHPSLSVVQSRLVSVSRALGPD